MLTFGDNKVLFNGSAENRERQGGDGKGADDRSAYQSWRAPAVIAVVTAAIPTRVSGRSRGCEKHAGKTQRKKTSKTSHLHPPTVIGPNCAGLAEPAMNGT